MHIRWFLFVILISTHAALTFFAPEGWAPVVAGTIYLPLMVLKSVGAPVFATAESGGWPAPSPLGWFSVAFVWLAVWWTVALLAARLFPERSSRT
jgi:hypothetical protein